jgi:mono/diheme cytochrome c family protein
VVERLRAILTIGFMMAGLSAALGGESGSGALERQGRALAERMCARCHATGNSGSSPHDAAPTFRELSRRVDLDTFPNRLRDGLVSGHPDMPTFRFTREDARALTAYLRSVQGR